MTTIEVIIGIVLLVLGICIGAYAEGRMVARHWKKKVANLEHVIYNLQIDLTLANENLDIWETQAIGKTGSNITPELLYKLSKGLDEALAKETPESLKEFLEEHKGEPVGHMYEPEVWGEHITEPEDVYIHEDHEDWLIENNHK